jgi:hypothetical protein
MQTPSQVLELAQFIPVGHGPHATRRRLAAPRPQDRSRAAGNSLRGDDDTTSWPRNGEEAALALGEPRPPLSHEGAGTNEAPRGPIRTTGPFRHEDCESFADPGAQLRVVRGVLGPLPGLERAHLAPASLPIAAGSRRAQGSEAQPPPPKLAEQVFANKAGIAARHLETQGGRAGQPWGATTTRPP